MAKKSKGAMRGRRSGNPFANEFGSTVTLGALGVAGAAYALSHVPKFGENLKYSFGNARHAGKTVYDAAAGGPEGYRAAKNLEQALGIVGRASEHEQIAADCLRDKYETREEFVTALTDVYRQNENVSRVASRLKLELEGTLKNFFEAGNSLKGETWRKIDDVIIKVYGMDPIAAREKSARLNEFYREAKEKFDATEKNEHTVKEFCGFLETVQEGNEAENIRYQALYPSIIERVKEGYEVEDILFETGDHNILGLRTDVSPSELEQTAQMVDGYKERVDETYESTMEVVPGMEPHDEINWTDYVADPLMGPLIIGSSVALAVKGASKLLPGIIERPLRWTLATPVRAASDAVVGTVKGTYSLGKKIVTKKKKCSDNKINKLPEGHMYHI